MSCTPMHQSGFRTVGGLFGHLLTLTFRVLTKQINRLLSAELLITLNLDCCLFSHEYWMLSRFQAKFSGALMTHIVFIICHGFLKSLQHVTVTKIIHVNIFWTDIEEIKVKYQVWHIFPIEKKCPFYLSWSVSQTVVETEVDEKWAITEGFDSGSVITLQISDFPSFISRLFIAAAFLSENKMMSLRQYNARNNRFGQTFAEAW